MQLARLEDENCPFTEFIFAPGSLLPPHLR